VSEASRNRQTTQELITELGRGIRARRIRAGLTQEELARRADLGLSALKHLESGQGANLTTLVKAVRALGCEDWLEALSPGAEPAVSPMQLLREQRRHPAPRQRVRRSGKRPQ
jgi:transcriptional regulator with XRE-family HTH domain